MPTYGPEITERHHGTPEEIARALVSPAPARWASIELETYDDAWPRRYEDAARTIVATLGEAVDGIEHVGSTSVPGLAAKSTIDIDLLLGSTDDEAAYVPALTVAGYRLVLREPEWHGHRLLVDEAAEVNLHVWPAHAPEPVRHRLFRDWLRTHPADRELYETTKRRLAVETVGRAGDYSLAKNAVIDEIFGRIFQAG